MERRYNGSAHIIIVLLLLMQSVQSALIIGCGAGKGNCMLFTQIVSSRAYTIDTLKLYN